MKCRVGQGQPQPGPRDQPHRAGDVRSPHQAGGQVVDEVRGHFGKRRAKTIPRTVRLSEAPSFGQPITTLTAIRASAYRAVTLEVIDGYNVKAGWDEVLAHSFRRRPTGRRALRDIPSVTSCRTRFSLDAFDEEALVALTNSIRELGVLQPIWCGPSRWPVRTDCGERRWRSAARYRLDPTIP